MAHDGAESQTVPESQLTRQVYATSAWHSTCPVLESGLVNVAVAHMENLLTRALRLRNFLARNYFRERAAAFTTEDGQQRMIEELKGAREFFSEIDAEMTKLVREIMRLKGLDSRLDEVMEEARQHGFGEPLPGL